MNFSTSRNSLQTALQHLSKATPTRSTIPILSSVLFTAQDQSLELRATDLEITLVTQVEANVKEGGGVAIPHRTLLEITNALPETEILVSVSKDYRVEIKTSFGNYDIAGAAPEDFPDLPEVDKKKEIEISSSLLKRLIEKTHFALSVDELKPALMGVLFEVEKNRVVAVATDGHRLCCCSRLDFSSSGYEGNVIVPKKFLSLLLPHLEEKGDVVLWVGENHVTISFNQSTVFSRIIDARYPDYKTVIPQDNNKILVVNREEMLASVKRVSIFSNKLSRQVELKISNGEAVITTEDPESASRGEERVSVEYEADDLSVAFNANYISGMLSHLDTEKVVIRLNTPISATLIGPETQLESEEIKMLLMPMRTGGQ